MITQIPLKTNIFALILFATSFNSTVIIGAGAPESVHTTMRRNPTMKTSIIWSIPETISAEYVSITRFESMSNPSAAKVLGNDFIEYRATVRNSTISTRTTQDEAGVVAKFDKVTGEYTSEIHLPETMPFGYYKKEPDWAAEGRFNELQKIYNTAVEAGVKTTTSEV